ncbi:Detected protein of confused Function [Hibiscus syriacus]|uniref:Detected protein of confused Function n=1 Tax=Hibiscus syriacus TaxID=106335 RepID=A0A6A3AWH2_HIBSY|nr:Detected protein of confused Function [Hibiscus syriacus]
MASFFQQSYQIFPVHFHVSLSDSPAFKRMWLAVREGSLPDVDSALALLKKTGGIINSRNTFGLTPLHIATWRNHIPIIQRLLAAGADPEARDGESGWSSLHRALNFGHLAVASVLLQSHASITLEDSTARTPIDLLSGPVMKVFESGLDSVAIGVFSWGSGVNYQLGTGNAHIQKLPCKLDSLYGSIIKLISAAKFHSVAVTAHGKVYTWGFGRGGCLGHPDLDIHSGQAAIITPRQVSCGLGTRQGQLGYTSEDTQPTPRRESSLKSRILAVANKHTAVVSDSGEVFTWGCNREGQLGYGTSNSASNYTPRIVEYAQRQDLLQPGYSVKRATSVSVGETHLLTIVFLYHPVYHPNMPQSDQAPKLEFNDEVEEFDEEFLFNDSEPSSMRSSVHKNDSEKTIPSLKSLCEKVAAKCLMDPQNAIQLLEIAESLGADDLSIDIVICNLDYILIVSSPAFASASPDVLANLEKSLDLRSSESWSYRRLPTPTATYSVIIYSDEEDGESEVLRTRDNKNITCFMNGGNRLGFFLQPNVDPNQGISEQVQALRKKLQQIEVLEMKQLGGYVLDNQQLAKLQRKPALENSLTDIGIPVEKSQLKGSCSVPIDAKGNKKSEVSRKQRRKSK